MGTYTGQGRGTGLTGTLGDPASGGANGYASTAFAQNGCQVVVADCSEAMVTDGEKLISELGLDNRVSFVLTRLEDQEFDVVLCHSVLEYVESTPVVLRSILQPLKLQVVVSIIWKNRYSIAYHQAFLRGDLQAAKAVIGATEANTIFGSMARAFAVDEIVKMLEAQGCVTQADYGLRCMMDCWGGNERKNRTQHTCRIGGLGFRAFGRAFLQAAGAVLPDDCPKSLTGFVMPASWQAGKVLGNPASTEHGRRTRRGVVPHPGALKVVLRARSAFGQASLSRGGGWAWLTKHASWYLPTLRVLSNCMRAAAKTILQK